MKKTLIFTKISVNSLFKEKFIFKKSFVTSYLKGVAFRSRKATPFTLLTPLSLWLSSF
jgi:hypothetical protein